MTGFSVGRSIFSADVWRRLMIMLIYAMDTSECICSTDLLRRQVSFAAWEQISGEYLCATDDPSEIFHSIRSKIKCALMCLENTECTGSNWRASGTCELFLHRVDNFALVADCRFYFPVHLKLAITIDDDYRLYFDGVEQTNLANHNNWQIADNILMERSTKVIAVEAINTDATTQSGILASTAGSSRLTDSLWKCSNSSYDGWNGVDFDDSNWAAATILGQNGVWPWGVIPGISSSVQWIWNNNQFTDTNIYCRIDLTQTTFTITVDDDFRLYFDGVEQSNLPNHGNWLKTDRASLPHGTRVVAVEAVNADLNTPAGILASSAGDSVQTDSQWRCSNTSYESWTDATFNDSNWTQAAVIGMNGINPWGFVPDIVSTASWIWIDANYSDAIIYCRLEMTRHCTP